jgi:hypothetical protein
MDSPPFRCRLAAAAAAAVVLALLLVPAAAVAQDISPYGINVHAPGGDRLARLDTVVEAGIGWIRIDLVWAFVERSPGDFDWQHYDALVAAAESRGLQVLAILAYTPQWATDGPELAGVPRNPEHWRRFVERAVARYRGRIDAWEVWNEPNLPHFWAGTRRQYLDLILKPAAAAIHAGDPVARVAGPGLAHLESRDWYYWLLDVLLEAGDELDVVTHHLYDRDGHEDVTEKLDGSTPFANDPDFWPAVSPSVREVLKEAGARDKTFWLTETGWESSETGEAGQAEEYVGLLGHWIGGARRRDWVEKIFFYELEDGSGFTWGILEEDGTPKPAWDALRSFAAANPTTPPLLLQGGRFSLEASWRNARTGEAGAGRPLPFSDQSGQFWFFAPGNVELVVKLLDGSAVNGQAWAFRGGLSDVEYWLNVSDRASGELRRYHNPAGTYCGGADTRAFPWATPAAASIWLGAGLPGPTAAEAALTGAAASCVEGPETLCLLGGRFRVEARWRNRRDGTSGDAGAVGSNGESGSFWFFGPGNLELTVKVLDGRALNDRFWVFFAALSDVEYWVTVTDTQTGAVRTYHNPPGTLCGQRDTAAF